MLLQEYGVMHLHLGGAGSDTLVFLVQYADRVELLEVNTHQRFRRQCAELIRHHRLESLPKPVVEKRKTRSAKKNGES